MLSFLAALAAVEMAAAPAAPALPQALTDPVWTSRPTAVDMARAYPDRAAKLDVEGRAILSCRATAKGRLADCEVQSQFPAGEGFAEATLKLASDFVMKPQDKDGRAVEGRPVRIPIRWVLPGGPKPRMLRLQEAMACYGQTAHRAQGEPTAPGAWQAAVYWSVQVAASAAAAGLRPTAYEHALIESHQLAAHGPSNPPKGADLAACLAKVPKG